MYLDKHDWANALVAYSAVATSTLGNADAEVKGRALEGLGFAKEGKGDLEGALASYRELETVDGRGFKELGMYHQARMLLAKGDKEGAKGLFKQVHDRLEKPGDDSNGTRYVQQMTDEALMRIDPSLVPPKESGKKLTKEQIEKLLQQAKDSAQKKPDGDPH